MKRILTLCVESMSIDSRGCRFEVREWSGLVDQERAGRISVFLSTEGTYPFHQGGVSTWCDMLVKRLKHVDYTILSIITDPFVTQKFELPKGVRLIKIPLWGTEEPSEHLDVRFSSTYLAKKRTTSHVI